MRTLRPPAVPLVVNDPYMSVWSMSDKLTDEWSKHWTETNHTMCGLIRIDGQPYRFMGGKFYFATLDVPIMEQTSLQVTPTRTIYTFAMSGVELTVTFMTALLPHNLELMSRPVTTVEMDVKATDGKLHDVALYFEVLSDWVIDNRSQKVVWGRHRLGDRDLLWMGSLEQPMLEKSGDDLRIDWGYLYTTSIQPAMSALALDTTMRTQFTQSGTLPTTDNSDMPTAVDNRPPHPAMAWAKELGSVDENRVSWQVILAYDDGFSVEYMYRRLRPYWRKDGVNASALVQSTIDRFEEIKSACVFYDNELMADLAQVGGSEYAQLSALAFRQCIAAHKLVIDGDIDGTPLFFSKENFSNGCMGTVDVTYPSSPFFLFFNPDILQAMLTPILDYASSARWKFPFAPHDIGRYPLANGQMYGGGEETDLNQMPVEECGNMLIMVTALCKVRSDIGYAHRYWDTLSMWANYLLDKGLDPENQLCTDDFAGHLAHNVNLSVKALVGIACYAWLCEQNGMLDKANDIRTTVEGMVEQWVAMADDGDHYRLTFDKPDTWSQKYNLVWDKLLDLRLFPDEVFEKELAYYKTKQLAYGLPLDNRSSYTKLDWIVWTASLAESKNEFTYFIRPMYKWLAESESRVPMTDWYYTDSGLQVAKMQARSVVGGVFVRLLCDKDLHQKWLDKRQ
ncbi:MAG: DUF4965 domain-containing protein [Chloroflexota bacterium]